MPHGSYKGVEEKTMNITMVYVELNDRGGPLRAYVDVVLDSNFMVHGLKVVEGERGMIVAMPSTRPKLMCPSCGHPDRPIVDDFCGNCGGQMPAYNERVAASAAKQKDGKFRAHYDVCHPLNPQTRRMIEDVVLEAYEAKLGEGAK